MYFSEHKANFYPNSSFPLNITEINYSFKPKYRSKNLYFLQIINDFNTNYIKNNWAFKPDKNIDVNKDVAYHKIKISIIQVIPKKKDLLYRTFYYYNQFNYLDKNSLVIYNRIIYNHHWKIFF